MNNNPNKTDTILNNIDFFYLHKILNKTNSTNRINSTNSKRIRRGGRVGLGGSTPRRRPTPPARSPHHEPTPLVPLERVQPEIDRKIQIEQITCHSLKDLLARRTRMRQAGRRVAASEPIHKQVPHFGDHKRKV